MNKNVYTILLIIIIYIITTDCYAHFSFINKIKSFLPTNTIEKIEQKEFPIGLINSLSLINGNGSITIKTGPQKSIFLRATKHAHKTIIDSLEIIAETINNNHLAVTTKNNHKKNKGAIDYELIVPTSLNIALTVSGKGNVFIKDIEGLIDVVTHDNIIVMNSKKLVSVQTLKKGSISIIDAHGPVEAYTQKGSIIAENIIHNFDGRSIKGKMNISYKKLPLTGSINLTSTSGNITLALPIKTNAEICGNTIHGTLMSDHEIMLNSRSTKLNKNAWIYFTRHVEGTLGNGDALIHINSIKGNIKIETIG